MADPTLSQAVVVEAFLSACLQHVSSEESIWTRLLRETGESSRRDLETFNSEQSPEANLVSLPYDLLALVISYLLPRSLLNLHGTGPSMHSRLPVLNDGFWRAHCQWVHGSGLVEIRQQSTNPNGNWKALLEALVFAQQKLIPSAANLEDLHQDRASWRREIEEIYQWIAHKYRQYCDPPQLPVGLLNRLHIWLILNAVNVDNHSNRSQTEES